MLNVVLTLLKPCYDPIPPPYRTGYYDPISSRKRRNAKLDREVLRMERLRKRLSHGGTYSDVDVEGNILRKRHMYANGRMERI